MKLLNGYPWFKVFLLLLSVLALLANAEAKSGEIVLTVDATEAPRRVLHASETIPVQPGPLTLCYAKWIPGEHGPTGPVVDLAALRITGAGKPLAWRHDLVDMYAIHLEIPAGLERIDLTFDFLFSPQVEGFSSGGSATSHLVVVNWNQVVLYPGNKPSDSIFIAPSLMLPDHWQFGTALEPTNESGPVIRFAAVSLTKLVDSPVLAGEHFRKIDLSPGSSVSHFINLASDGEEPLSMPSQQVVAYQRLITEARAMFGARHYDHYDFLLTLSDQVAHFGLEHHQCSDDRPPERFLIDDDIQRSWAILLPHEYAHSWNGKYRRPAGLSGSDFSTPMKGDLLWVYEGLTTYLGEILAVRSGVMTPDDYRQGLACKAARLDNLPGRTWRSLQDVADAAQVLYGARQDWESVRRSVDFYDESDLIWLEVEVMIRDMTGGKKSLTDFCRLFFGGKDSSPELSTYTFDDVTAALNSIAPYDWKAFFLNRLQSLDPHAPLGGIEKSGWRLVYRDTVGSLQKAGETADKIIDSRYSLGVYLKEDGTMSDVIPGFPAASAGMAPGMKLIAINGRKFTKDIFRDALKYNKSDSTKFELLASNGDFFKTYLVNYHGGERYPWLERDTSKADVLSEIIRPIATK
jgi:predicted metalloprotease with PDZ domain